MCECLTAYGCSAQKFRLVNQSLLSVLFNEQIVRKLTEKRLSDQNILKTVSITEAYAPRHSR